MLLGGKVVVFDMSVFFCQNPFLAILGLKKVKALIAGPLKKNTFFAAFLSDQVSDAY